MNFKMVRPHLTLDKWLSTDTDLKKISWIKRAT